MNGTVASHLDVPAATAKQGGAEPDLLHQDARCQTDDFQQYARRLPQMTVLAGD